MAPTDLLLVEGPDDVYAFVEILTHYSLPLSKQNLDEPGKIALKSSGGIANLRESLPRRLEIVDTRHIGIIVDADEEPLNRWVSIRDVLRDKGYEDVPPAPLPAGTIMTHALRPTVGVWLMPNNQHPGALENFAHSLIPTDDVLWNRVEACVDAIPETERRWRSSYLMKAKMPTWLAWQEEPGAPIGLALTRRYLDADAPQVLPLVTWIRTLFEL